MGVAKNNGASIKIAVEYDGGCIVLPLREANKVGQVLVGLTSFIARDGYRFARLPMPEVPKPPMVVPNWPADDAKPQG